YALPALRRPDRPARAACARLHPLPRHDTPLRASRPARALRGAAPRGGTATEIRSRGIAGRPARRTLGGLGRGAVASLAGRRDRTRAAALAAALPARLQSK